MNGKHTHKADVDEGGQYEIRIQGHLDDRWSGWFEGFTFTPDENGDTLIYGLVKDQAALFGLLRKVRDAGMLLVSVNRINAPQSDFSDDE